MGLTIIVKESKADQQRRIYEQRAPANINHPIEGIVRSVDEAHDIAYHTHDYEGHNAFLVQGDNPESRQAAYDNAQRLVQQGGYDIDPADVVKQWSEK